MSKRHKIEPEKEKKRFGMEIHMRKRIKLFFLCTLFFLLPVSQYVYAAEGENVYDQALLLSAEEITSLDAVIGETKEETGWNIFAVTTEDAAGKTSMEYADDFFDEKSLEKEDGVVLLIDMDNREIYISTGGAAIRYLTDKRLDTILDEAYEDVSAGAYADCFATMLSGVQKFYEAGIPDNQKTYDVETGKTSVYRSLTVVEIAVAAVAAIIAGIVTCLIIVGKYRLKFGTYQYQYRDFSKVTLSNSEDIFVHDTITHRRIPQNNGGNGNSGGRSSVHTSSSGRSHGGAGRKF